MSAVRSPDAPAIETLDVLDVQRVVSAAARAIDHDRLSVAVVDRAGRVLAIWRRPDATAIDQETALSLARTGAFFSNNQAALTSRTVRFISGIHFPPGVKNQPNADLYGIENTNRVDYHVTFNPGKEFPAPLNIDGTGPSLGITTGKRDLRDSDPRAVNPGGVPIFKRGQVVGGVGVAGGTGEPGGMTPAEAEFAAASGSVPDGRPEYRLRPPLTGAIYADGIKLPGIETGRRPPGSRGGTFTGTPDYRVLPTEGGTAPDRYLVGPTGSSELSMVEVSRIISQSAEIAYRTRALIRLPRGSRTRMVIAVGDLEGNMLAVYRMPDSTTFSVDVAIAKARNVVYFSGEGLVRGDLAGIRTGTAVTNRTISFGAQPLFPAGINRTKPGPFFELFKYDSDNPGTQGSQPDNPNQNGVVFFPGSIPLYKAGKLAGGLGVSGDGVAQDDFVSFVGADGFRPPRRIRADRLKIRGARMPFLKFPRNPLK